MKKNSSKNNIGLIILCCIPVCITILILIIKPYTYNEHGKNSVSNNNTDKEKINTSYLTINNVKLTSNSSYTICTGTISVKPYSPYKYHYIQVKGAFKNNYGATIDTDWTYAIGSEWLEPGESTKFRLSVNKDYSIKDCTVTIME